MSDNPYEAPPTESVPPEPGGPSVVDAGLTAALAAIFGGMVGGVLGVVMASVASTVSRNSAAFHLQIVVITLGGPFGVTLNGIIDGAMSAFLAGLTSGGLRRIWKPKDRGAKIAGGVLLVLRAGASLVVGAAVGTLLGAWSGLGFDYLTLGKLGAVLGLVSTSFGLASASVVRRLRWRHYAAGQKDTSRQES